MSGGTDSSVTAALLVERGCDVLGVTARMCDDATGGGGPDAAAEARRVCAHLGIRHVEVDLRDTFRQHVMTHFADEYTHGRTPSPCVTCNETIKFGALLRHTASLGYSRLATGHYVRIVARDGVRHLHRGRDRSRDQSYFLHRLTQDQLAHAMFPLAAMLKQEEVVPWARKHGLPVTITDESREVCFAAPGRHHRVVERLCPHAGKAGEIVDREGRVLGQHAGIHRVTVGQRRGLGLSGGPPRYVVQIDCGRNRIVVGSRDEATAAGGVIEDATWICGAPPGADASCAIAVRYQHGPVPAILTPLNENRYRITFNKPQFGVAPGQAAVVYCGDEVMGGGWITD